LREDDAGAGQMLKVKKVALDDIYVPTARRATLDPAAAERLAEDILENGMTTPIQVRHDGKRHVLVEGLHRLEAARLLGESAIDAYLVQAKRH
jgi:ParB-like chromosome segregation protein Spo0J